MRFVASAIKAQRHPSIGLVLLIGMMGTMALLALLAGSPARAALPYSASGSLISNGGGTGTGFTTTSFGPPANVQITLQGARPNATYQVFACLALTTGGFSCVGRNNPPAYQQVQVAPKAIAPITVTLAQQGTLSTDANGNGSAVIGLPQQLLVDTPASMYDVVQLINSNDATDSYTAVDMLSKAPPVTGVNAPTPLGVTLALSVPVYVFAQFPGYTYPVAVTTISSYPFVPFVTLPAGVVGYQFPYSVYTGPCPGGTAPLAQPAPGGVINFIC